MKGKRQTPDLVGVDSYKKTESDSSLSKVEGFFLAIVLVLAINVLTVVAYTFPLFRWFFISIFSFFKWLFGHFF
jgi:hypothetical protein